MVDKIFFAGWHIKYSTALLGGLGLTALSYFVRWQQKSFYLLAHKIRLGELLTGYSLLRRSIKLICWVTIILILTAMCWRPQWGKKEEIIHHQGRNVMVALDISRSMLAQDISPNRLEFAKLKIKSLFSHLHTSRAGLIVFSGNALVQCPFTSDLNAFDLFLNQIGVETVSSGSTSVENALIKAIEAFDHMGKNHSRILVLITDGEDFSVNIEKTIERARQENIYVVTLGIGSPEGAPIPIIGINGRINGYEKDEKGGLALSKLNEELLKSITHSLKGLYQLADYHDNDISQIVKFIENFETSQLEESSISMYEERYPLFAGIAATLLALDLLW